MPVRPSLSSSQVLGRRHPGGVERPPARSAASTAGSSTCSGAARGPACCGAPPLVEFPARPFGEGRAPHLFPARELGVLADEVAGQQPPARAPSPSRRGRPAPQRNLPAAIEQIPLPLQFGKRRTAVTGLGGGTVRSRSPARLRSPARRARKHAPPPRARRSPARGLVVELGESRWPAPPTSSRPHNRPGAANRRIGRRTHSWATSPARACPRRRQTARWPGWC